MSYFVIEINISDATQRIADHDLGAIAKIVEAAGGRLVDSCLNERAQAWNLIVEVRSPQAIFDLLKANTFDIGPIRHIFLLETYHREDGKSYAKPSSFAKFFSGMDRRNTAAIEVCPH